MQLVSKDTIEYSIHYHLLHHPEFKGIATTTHTWALFDFCAKLISQRCTVFVYIKVILTLMQEIIFNFAF
jgi:hypothetical protein